MKISGISKFEANIMLIVWEKKEITVREVHEELLRQELKDKDSNFIPYTTVMSTMASLAEKKILKVDRTKKTYAYFAILNRKELARSIISTVAEKLL